jgi:hypothetical protein
MTKYEQGVADEHSRIVALLDTYEITALRGGVIMLEPKRVTGWQGDHHESGSLSSYFRRGCRCDACKGVASAWQRERKAAKNGVPSPEQILEARSPAGGWTKATLAGWGVGWPPPKGWKADLEERYAEIIAPKTKKQMAQRRQVTFQ